MKRSVRKSFKWLLVLGMIAGLLGALLPTGPALAGTLSFSTTSLPTTKGMVVNDRAKGPGSDNGRNVLAVSPDYANDSRVWVALDSDGDNVSNGTDTDSEPPAPLLDQLGETGTDGEPFGDGTGIDEVAYSTNGGTTWTAVDPSGDDTSPIVAIVPSPLYASDNTVFVASTMRVYRSTNGGSSYTQLGAEQGVVTGSAISLAITSLAVAPNYNGVGEIAVGLADPSSGIDGCPEGEAEGRDCARVWGRGDVLNWTSIAENDMAADVTAIAYSPSFSADGVMMVVASAPSSVSRTLATARTADTLIDDPIVTGTNLYHVVGQGTEWNGSFDPIVIDDGLQDVGQAGTGIVSSALAVAPNYDGSNNSRRLVYVGTNRGGDGEDDGVYRVTTKSSEAQGATTVSNIAIAGSVASPRVLFGSTSASATYLTTDFTSNSKTPTIDDPDPVPGGGGSAGTGTAVALSPDGSTAFALVASALGGNGGFSRSADGGSTFSQVSLLNNVGAFTDKGMAFIAEDLTADPQITADVPAVPGAAIAGFAVSPDFDTSGHMVAGAAANAADGTDVTLYSANGGANWMVVDTGTFTGNTIAFAYSPNFATDNTIYSADLGANILERSTNGGLSWASRSQVACGSSMISSIAAADGSTVFVGCADGGFRKSVNGGFLFSAATGSGPGGNVSDIAMSPSYSEDNSILIGQASQARLSTDGGSSFSRLGSRGPGSGKTQVAFHSDYATNGMVYAGTEGSGTDTDKGGVYRWTVGTSTSWLTIEGATMVVGLGVGADGTLYAASGDPFDVADDEVPDDTGGIFTSATPTASTSAGIGLAQVGVTRSGTNLKDGEVVGGFAHATTAGSERLWVAITNPGGDTDTTPAVDNWRHYADTIGRTMRPGGLLPADGAVVGTSNLSGSGITGFTIGWDAVSGATGYNYQWSISSTFARGSTCTSGVSSARAVAEGGICDADAAGTADNPTARPGNTTYYWRVRVATPVIGAYSATQSLTAALLTGTSAGLPTLSQPNAGNLSPETSREVPLRPLFVWTAVDNATHYDLQVSTDGTFLDPNQMVVDRSGATQLGNQIAFQSDVQLSPSTVYFWRVRGVSATSQGAYPPAAAFTTTASAAEVGRPAAQVLATLEATGNLEVVTGYDYASGLWQSYVPGLPGNSLVTIQPNSVLFITVMQDTTVVVSGVAYNLSANTPTPVPVGTAVTIAVQ